MPDKLRYWKQKVLKIYPEAICYDIQIFNEYVIHKDAHRNGFNFNTISKTEPDAWMYTYQNHLSYFNKLNNIRINNFLRHKAYGNRR